MKRIEERYLTLKRFTILVVCSLSLVVADTGALAQGGKPKSTAVTSTLNDAGDVTFSTNNRLQSDELGAYVHGVGGIKTEIQGIGDWYLDTNGTSRLVLVDFRDAVPGSGANPPFNWQLVKARLISKCSLVGANYTTIPLGATVSCPLHAVFAHGGSSYRLTMNPLNVAATSFVNVTCGGVNASGNCNRWKVLPITQADNSVRSIAVLFRDTTVKGKTTTTMLGYFYMTFDLDMATL